MNRKILLFLLLMVSFLFSERILVHKLDGTYLYYELEGLNEITFYDVESMLLTIEFLNGDTEEMGLSIIENIEFIQSPEFSLVINLTDASNYEVDIRQVSSISFSEITLVSEQPEITVDFFKNYPNPFNPVTNIQFQLLETCRAKIEIFNIRGEKISDLKNEVLSAGSYNLVWDGRDNMDQPVPSGVYYCRISANDFQKTRKIMLLK